MSIAAVLITTATATLVVFGLLWAVSLVRRDVSIVDIYWGPGFTLIAILCIILGAGGGARPFLVLGLSALWGMRLGAHLLRRNWGEPEDRRYAAMRRHYGRSFWIVSLAIVFGLQAVLMWIVSLPLQWAVLATHPPRLTWIDAAATIVCVAGLLCEAVADYQLDRFKADPANAGAVMDRGLWRYTRHPNYFGDCLFWWGLFLFALGTPAGYLTAISPVIMTTLLLRVSGVALLERTIVHRRPAYAEYVRRTSPFIPWPPRAPLQSGMQ